MGNIGKKLLLGGILAAGLSFAALASVNAEPNNGGNEAPDTPATDMHGLPGNNPAHGGNSANPHDVGANGGDGMHNIDGGAPGIDGVSAAEGGEPPACEMHGGMGNDDGIKDKKNCQQNK